MWNSLFNSWILSEAAFKKAVNCILHNSFHIVIHMNDISWGYARHTSQTLQVYSTQL